MIGPPKSGGEAFARRLNRNDWLRNNEEKTTYSHAAEACFASVFCISVGSLVAVGLVESLRKGCELALG